MTTKAEFDSWVDRGRNDPKGYTHLIVIADTFSYENYPVFAKGVDEMEAIRKRGNAAEMSRVMEVVEL